MAISGLYFHSYAIYSITKTDDAYGGWIESMVLKQGATPCYLTTLGGGKQVFNGKLQVIASHRLFCDPCDIKSSDKIYSIDYNIYFDIIRIDPCLGHHYELLLQEITDPQDFDNSSSSSSSIDSSSSSSSTSESSSTSSSTSSSSES